MTTDIKDKIDRYVMNKMASGEHKAFEEEMHNDEGLRKEVELTMLVAEGFRRKSEQDVINEMQRMEEDELRGILVATESKYKREARTGEKKPVRRKRMIRLSTAIAVPAACLLIYIAFQPKYSSGELFADYFKAATYEPLRGDYGMDEGREDAVAEAFADYQNGDYAGALDAFSKAITDVNIHDVQDEVIFYLAVSLVETAQYENAIEKFGYLTRAANSEYRPESEWNLALVYLKSGLRYDARKTLHDIIYDNGPFAPQAKELLDKVSRKKWQIF